MKKQKNKILCTLIAAALALTVTATPAVSSFAADSGFSSSFSDVPQGSWALSAIQSAKDYSLMQGRDESHFGYGEPVSKAEFVTILCNMFRWTPLSPTAPSFPDVSGGHWSYSYVETALAHGVMDKAAGFSPDSPLTKEDATVMLVRALGLGAAAKLEDSATLPFTDVTAHKGYIAVAKNIGMVSGTTATTFKPKDILLREHAASMLTQVYSKYQGDTEFLHGFYAISSYSQKELTKDMDAVTLMWSAMTMTGGVPMLSTSGDGGSQYKLPDSYESVTSYLDSNNTKAHLGVYMDSSGGVKNLLTSPDSRTAAVNAIVAELTKTYDEVGKNPYSGVTIDFEGLKGAETKQGLNDFLTALSARLVPLGKTLYVAVQPALPDGVYYDGFDFKTIGSIADKVILMAHDYNPTSLEGYVGTEWHKNAALTPISQVYYALKAASDETTGVSDKSKLTLAISFAGIGWQVSADGKLLSGSPVQVGPQTIATRLAEPSTVTGFSETYRNPYMTYMAQNGNNYFVWYENSQSVFEKAALARLFGVDGISLWRLGNIPNYDGYNVMESYQ